MKRKILLIMSLIFLMCTLTGCEDDLSISVLGGLEEDLSTRFISTKTDTEFLENQGFISSDTASTVYKNIEKLQKTWLSICDEGTSTEKKELFKDEKKKIVKAINKKIKNEDLNIVQACSAIRCIGHGISGFDMKNDNAVSDYIMMKIYNYKENGGRPAGVWHIKTDALNGDWPPYMIGGIEVADDGTWYEISNKFKPITIVPDSVGTEVNEALDFPIYVLRPDVYETLGEDASLDTLYSKLKPLFYDGDTLKKDIDDEKLLKYFYEVKVESDIPLTLRYLVEKNDVIDYWDNILMTTTWNDTLVNNVGTDIIVQQTMKSPKDKKIYTEPVLSIRLREYNHTAVDNLNMTLGLFNNDGKAGRYIVSKGVAGDDNGNKIYLVEYPVSAIESFEARNLNGKETAVAKFVNSGIGINIITGSIIKYDVDSSGNYKTTGVYLEDTDNYYTSAIFGDASGKSSFSIFGYTKDFKLDLQSLKDANSGENINLGTYNTSTARIVLNDYLEATYAPGYTNESKVVVFGRKIRFNIKDNIVEKTVPNGFDPHEDRHINIKTHKGVESVYQQELVYDTSEDVAIYVDKDGNKNSRTLKVTDFCDLQKLIGNTSGSDLDNCQVYSIARESVGPEVVEAVTETSSERPEPSELKQVTINSTTETKIINMSTVFPSNKLGVDDYINYFNSKDKLPSQQRFWVMTVKTGIFDSGLFEFWINVPSNEASLIWWNDYLDKNNFVYEVSLDKTNNYLFNNYKTQVQKAGVVLIDLDTIADLAEMYEKEADKERIKTIRTTFIVIGWAIMAFSLVLLVLWAIDTNTDIGIGLLDKVTFGHWTAVKYDSELPKNNDGHTYLTFSKMLLRCLILIAIGILIIKVDIISTVHTIISLFGRLASEIEKIIRGI